MSDFYLDERMMQLRVREEHRQATYRRLQKLARPGRTRWLARQRNQTLSWFGKALVRCGRQLLSYISQPAPRIRGPEGRRA